MISPLENNELYGHTESEAQLFRLVQQKKLPHALLLAGPQGIGKATLAYRLAKYLLTGAVSAEPTMGLFGPEPIAESLASVTEHPAIRRIIAGSHGDLLVIQPEPDEKRKTSADTIFIEQVREVINFMRHTPAESDWRIVIIDPADALNNAAANALLKVLEEPPAQALLILISHQPGKLLPTIRSRCRQMLLHAPEMEVCEKIFNHVHQSIPQHELKALLELAQGTPGRAIYYHQNSALELYNQIMYALASTQPKDIVKFANDIAKAASANSMMLKTIFLVVLYRLSMFSIAPEQLQEIQPGEKQHFTELLIRKPLEHWLRLWEKTEMLLQQVSSLTLDRQQVMLSLLHYAAGKS